MSLSAPQIDWLNTLARLNPGLIADKAEADAEDDGKEDAAANAKGEAKDKNKDSDALAQLRIEFARKREDEMIADGERKDLLLSQSLDAVYAYKDVLRAAFDFEMGSRFNRDKMRDDKHGNQEDEVDSRDINKRAQNGKEIHAYKDGKKNDALISQASNAYTIVVKEKRRLVAAMTDRSSLNEKALRIESTAIVLFAPAEVAELFFAPLVRGRLIPDGAIENDFSGTQRMLDATNALYIENELTSASDPQSRIDEMAQTAMNIASGVGNLVASQFGADTDLVKGLIDAGTSLVVLGVSATTLALGVEDKDVTDLAAKIPEIIGKIVGSVASPAIGEAISGVGSAAVRVAGGAVKALKGKDVSAGDLGNLVRDCCIAVIQAAANENQQLAQVAPLIVDAANLIDGNKVQSIAAGLKKGDWKMVSSGIFSMLSDFATAAGTIASDSAGAANKTLNDQLGDALEDGGKVAGEALALVSDLLTAKDAGEVADKLQNGVPDIIGSIVGAVTHDDDIGATVTAGCSAACKVGDLIAKAARGEAISADDIGSAVSKTVDAAFSIASNGVNASDAADKDTVTAELAAVKGQLTAAADAFGASDDGQKLLTGTPAERKKAAGKLLLNLLLNLPGAAGSMADASGTDDGQKAGGALDQAADIIDTLSAAGDKAAEKLKAANEEVAQIREELEAQHDKDAVAEADAIMDEAERELVEYRKKVQTALQSGDGEAAILDLIKTMKRDAAILKAAIAIGSAGIEVAAQFFGPLAIGKEVLKMSAHIAAAVQRAIDLKKMLDAQEWAESGASKYRSTIDNFIKNQGEQLTEHSLKAAMCAVRITAEAAATAYPQAKPVATAATLLQSGVDLAACAYKEADLRHAWSVTKQALSDPDDRKLGLRARRLNATLAKWSIAYGATTEKDPVAVKTMNEVGLTNNMLQSEGVGEKLVKDFLVARFPEDAKVTFKWDTTTEWQKKLPTPELNATNMFKAFSVMKDAATDFYDSPPGVISAPPNAMVGSLNSFQKQSKALADAAKTAGQLRAAGTKDGATAMDMTAFRDALTTQIDLGKDSLRLAKVFKGETTKVVSGIHGMKAQKNGFDKRRFDGTKSSLADVAIAYRSLIEDEIDMLESDLLTPVIDKTRVDVALKKQAATAT